MWKILDQSSTYKILLLILCCQEIINEMKENFEARGERRFKHGDVKQYLRLLL